MGTPAPPPPPPYTPAPYLAKGSFLTPEELAYYYQDFCASLEYVSSAPDHVFERIVSNLNHSFTAHLGLERDRDRDRDPKALERIKTLELSNYQLKAELAELKATMSGAASSNPAIGSFHTSEVRSSDEARVTTTKEISFTRSYSTPPTLPLGITSFDLSRDIYIRLASAASDIQKDGFRVCLNAWRESVIRSAGCAWMEIDPNDPDFQCGTFNTEDDHPWSKPQLETTRKIVFPRPYSSPPQIVVWIKTLCFSHKTDWRLRTYATDITATDFNLHIDAWGDSVLYLASASWVSYPKNKPKVFSGSFNTTDLRSGEFSPKNSGHVKFGNNDIQFAAPPRVMVAINRIDISSKRDMRLSLKTSDITATGMNWILDGWSDTILYSAGASFIALG